jgi:Leucine-rich repeat (LRR) protein
LNPLVLDPEALPTAQQIEIDLLRDGLAQAQAEIQHLKRALALNTATQRELALKRPRFDEGYGETRTPRSDAVSSSSQARAEQLMNRMNKFNEGLTDWKKEASQGVKKLMSELKACFDAQVRYQAGDMSKKDAATKLMLAGADSSSLPACLSELILLEELKIFNSGLQELPRGFEKLQNLKRLHLITGNLTTDNLPFDALTNLKSLHLGSNELYDAAFSFSREMQLKELSFESCYTMFSLPNALSEAVALEKLTISTCTAISDWKRLGDIPNLKYLEIDSCKTPADCLQSFIGNLKKLEHLDFSNEDNLKEIPDSIGQLTELKSLMLICNDELNSIPDSIGLLSNLEQLEISSCKSLTSIPEAIAQLPNLKKLEIQDCPNLQVPDSIKSLPCCIIN